MLRKSDAAKLRVTHETGKDIPGQMDLPVEGTAYRAAGM